MRAGMLHHKIRIERKTTIKDDFGQPLDTWILIAERRADIDGLTGEEYIAANAENSTITTRIRLRYESLLSELSNNDRLVHKSTIYDIKSVINPRERNRDLIVMCKVDS